MVELCAGIGGFSLAATWAGYEVVGQVEIDPWCQRVLAKHWPDAMRMNDVREVRGDEFGPIDLVAAGIPCQPYSVAGKRGGASDDRALWPAVRSIVERARPDRVLIENVGGFIDMALDMVLADLESLGYSVGAVALPACAVEAPHIRNRAWCMADSNRERELQPGRCESNIRRRTRDSRATYLRRITDVRQLDVEPHGVPAGLVRPVTWGAGSPVVGADGEVDRAKKVKAAGNAIVPQVAYEILRAWDEA